MFARVFSPQGENVTAELLLKQGGAIIQTIPVQMTPPKSVKNAIDWEAVVMLNDVPAGCYVLDLTARQSAPQALHRTVAFDVK